MILKGLQISHAASRYFSSIWQQRINDFIPIHIDSSGNVVIRQYNWREDSVEPKTKLILPDHGAELKLSEKLEVSNTGLDSEVTAHVPIKSPLFLKCIESAGVDIEGHEADLEITTVSGKCSLKSVKCEKTSIVSKTGDIDLNSIVSNCSITTGGNVYARKIQGENLTINTVKGNVHIESLYAPESLIYGKYGDVKLDNVHGSCKIVSASGSITVGSSQDDLEIRCRGGPVHVTLHDIAKSVYIQSFGGPVSLYMSDEACSKAMLSVQSSAKATVTDEVQTLVNKNQEATAVVFISTYDAPTFVGKAKSWGEGLWDKLS